MLKNLSLIVLAALAVSSCRHSSNTEATQNQPIAVVVTKVQLVEQQKQLSLSATTEPDHLVNIGFMVAGKIDRVNFEEGQYIQKGQLVASIDPADYQLGLAAANADLNKANDEFKRLKLMYDRGSLTPSDYQTAVKSVAQANDNQKSQLKKVNDTRLYAPISGLLAKRGAEPGTVVGQGTPVFSIVDIEPIKVSASVPEDELNQIQTGMKTKVRIVALDTTYTGAISLVGAVADAATRAYTVKINLRNPGRKIRPGMVAEVILSSDKKTKLLTLPAEAVLHDAAEAAYVYVVDRQKHKAFKRKVTVGNVFERSIEITSGLQQGETVITGGQQKVNDGADVAVKESAL